jgi:hypothetical protein
LPRTGHYASSTINLRLAAISPAGGFHHLLIQALATAIEPGLEFARASWFVRPGVINVSDVFCSDALP